MGKDNYLTSLEPICMIFLFVRSVTYTEYDIHVINKFYEGYPLKDKMKTSYRVSVHFSV